MDHEWVEGVVQDWDERDGLGAIASPATPGGCWFHYSMIEVPGLRTLAVGQPVHFTFESDVDQDGFTFRALQVRPSI